MSAQDVYTYTYVCYWSISEESSLNVSISIVSSDWNILKQDLNFQIMLLVSKKIEFMIKNRSLFQFEQNYDYFFNIPFSNN